MLGLIEAAEAEAALLAYRKQTLKEPELPHGYSRGKREKPQPTRLTLCILAVALAAFAGAVFAHIYTYR